MKGLSLFSGSGIGETYLSQVGIDIVVANEIIEKRAQLYKHLYPTCNMICGDIRDDNIFDQIISNSKNVEFLIASPPCQGMSIAGKNRHQNTMVEDPRNYLIYYVIKAITILKPKCVLIENVPALLKIKFPYKKGTLTILDILDKEFGKDYKIDGKVVDAADYGVPQTRLRAIIKMHSGGSCWPWPKVTEKKLGLTSNLVTLL